MWGSDACSDTALSTHVRLSLDRWIPARFFQLAAGAVQLPLLAPPVLASHLSLTSLSSIQLDRFQSFLGSAKLNDHSFRPFLHGVDTID